jgi:hypothetical protein
VKEVKIENFPLKVSDKEKKTMTDRKKFLILQGG